MTDFFKPYGLYIGGEKQPPERSSNRGYDATRREIAALSVEAARNASREEVIGLLLNQGIPDHHVLETLRSKLGIEEPTV